MTEKNRILAKPKRPYKKSGSKGIGDSHGSRKTAPRRRKFLPYKEARASVCSLNLKTELEWRFYCKGELTEKGTRPHDIPSNPSKTYAGKGWKCWGEWLGTNSTPHCRKFLSYEEARALTCSLGLKSKVEWMSYRKGELTKKRSHLKNIPANPEATYAGKGWKSWGEWLGKGTTRHNCKVFRPFKNARKFIHSLKLTSELEWRFYCKGELTAKGTRPDDIPSNPDYTYAEKGWKGYGDWLGTGRISNKLRVHRPFEEAREFVRYLHLKSTKEWIKFTKGQMPEKGTLPSDIPANPCGAYRNKGWLGVGDWVGTGVLATKFRKYRSFHDARTFVRSLKLRNQDEWRKFCMRKMPEKGTLPSDIPTNPHHTYAKSGWVNTADWLGKLRH
jgi:hypothetical protein